MLRSLFFDPLSNLVLAIVNLFTKLFSSLSACFGRKENTGECTDEGTEAKACKEVHQRVSIF